MFLTKGGSCVLYLWGGVGWFEGFWALTQSAATGPGYLWRDYAPHEITYMGMNKYCFVCSALGVWMVGFRGCVYIGGASTPEPLNP